MGIVFCYWSGGYEHRMVLPQNTWEGYEFRDWWGLHLRMRLENGCLEVLDQRTNKISKYPVESNELNVITHEAP